MRLVNERWIGALAMCLILLTGCSNSLRNLKDGEALPTSQGLLVGTIRWQQGEHGVAAYGGGQYGTHVLLQIRHIGSERVYSHDMKEPRLLLTLPAGEYMFERITISNVSLNVRRTTAQKAAPWLLNVLTLPLGVATIPTGGVNLSFEPTLSAFQIKAGEATYIGTITIDFPDPLPHGSNRVNFSVADEEDTAAENLVIRFPGTERVEKHLLLVQ